MKSKKHNRLAAFVLSATMAFSAFAVDIHAEETAKPWSIDGTSYETLVEAVAAAGNGATITLANDATGNGVIVPSGKNITIDFNTHNYDINGTLVGSTGTATQAFQLLKGSTVTLKNGSITSGKAKMLVQNYGNLTVDGMDLNGSGLQQAGAYTLSNNCGNVVIKDSTITAKEGGFAFDVYYWPSYGYGEGVTVTVEGNTTINGNVEYGSDGSAAGVANVATSAKLNIKGGTFKGEIKKGNAGDPEQTGISISGGSFSVKPNESYFAEGFTISDKQDANGNYSVVEESSSTADAMKSLKTAIEQATAKLNDGKNYTPASKDRLTAALNAAKAVKDDATIAEITSATNILNEAVAALQVSTLDLTKLAEVIKAAEQEAAKTDIYTEHSINALKQSIAAAQETYEHASNQEEIDVKVEMLEKAIADIIKTASDDPTPEERDEIIDAETNVKVSAQKGVIDPAAKLSVKALTAENASEKIAAAFNSLKGKFIAYDIKLMKDNVEIQPNGTVIVTLDIPEDFDFEKIMLYHIGEDGVVSAMPFYATKDKVTFTTNHFSVFALVDETGKVAEKDKTDTGKKDSPIKETADARPNTSAAACVMMMFAACAYIGLTKKKIGYKA